MAKTKVVRPVWRKFHERFTPRAAAWVREGGHALVYRDDGDLSVLLGTNGTGELTEQALWALLAVEQRRSKKLTDGPAKGLRTAHVQPHAEWAVIDWCERDAGFEKPTRVLSLDCIACAACCHDANVLLDPDDLERFRDGGRADLTKSKFIKRGRDGKMHLRFIDKGACQHLLADRRCGIYELRPFNCRAFPAGTEACLAARESTNAWRDGIPRSDAP